MERTITSTTNAAPPASEKPTDNIPLPAPVKHPLRFAIAGVTDKIPDLKKFIAEQEFDPDLRTYILSELDELTSNAAEIHLHDVEQPGGGFDLHLSIKPRHLGGLASQIHRPAAAEPEVKLG